VIRPVGRFEIGRHWWRLLTVVIDGLSLNGFVAIKRGFLAKSPLLLANWNGRRPARRPDSRLTNVHQVTDGDRTILVKVLRKAAAKGHPPHFRLAEVEITRDGWER
jgi:hypothetical protein